MKWYGYAPGFGYVIDLEADNEQQARAAMRRRLGVGSLPGGTMVWRDRGEHY